VKKSEVCPSAKMFGEIVADGVTLVPASDSTASATSESSGTANKNVQPFRLIGSLF